MSEVLNKWLARISKTSTDQTTGKLKRGELVGTGFITVFPWLMTCNHVVACCEGGKSEDIFRPGALKSIIIDFPLCNGKEKGLYQAEIVISKPKLPTPRLNDIHDVAILRLKLVDGESILEEDDWASQWKYEQGGNYVDHKVSAKGFFVDKGSLLEGVSKTSCADGLIELDLDVDESIGGASGAPVWSKDEHTIIGMLSSQRGENAPTFKFKKVYMIPMHKILDACEEHKDAVLEYKEQSFDFETGSESEEFMENVKYEIISYLSTKDLQPTLDLFVKKQKWSEDSLDAEALCGKILAECPKDSAKIIRNLTVCTRKSLEKFDREGNFKSAQFLIKDMRKLISLLSLHVLKKETIKKLRQDVVYSSTAININIAHDTMVSAELVSAASMQTFPFFHKPEKTATVQGQYAVSHFDLEVGIGKDDRWIDEIGKKVWKVFFGKKVDESSYTRQDLRDHIRRELCADDPEKKNCYLVVSISPQDKNESPLLDKENRRKFKEKIPELPIIILDNSISGAAYVSFDRDLMVELFNFFNMSEERYDKGDDLQSDG